MAGFGLQKTGALELILLADGIVRAAGGGGDGGCIESPDPARLIIRSIHLSL